MIDHLLTFTSERVAREALKPLGYWRDGRWDTSQTFPDVKIILADAVWNTRDPQSPVLVTPEVLAPGWSIVVALMNVSSRLRDLPNRACRSLTESDRATPKAKFYEYAISSGTLTEGVATDFKASRVSRDARGRVSRITGTVSPARAGTQYPR